MRRELKAVSRLGLSLVAGVLLTWPASAAQADGTVTHADPIPPPGFGMFSPPSSERMAAADWCGDEKASDDTLHETGPLDAHKIRAIEAVPADRVPSHDTRVAIQRAVATLSDYLALESGRRRSLRFDMGTRCGPRYLDILTIRLPRVAADYGAGACNVGPLFGDVRSSLPEAKGPRNAVIFAPTIRCSSMAGYGELRNDDRPGPLNSSNRGGFLAVTFLMNSGVALHEIGHNLGAVQRSAPHSDPYGHCWDEDDVMCYPYTQYLPQSPLRPCDSRQAAPFDCGKDDYFNPDPAPGSYLDTHWNVYDSAFMCELADCVPVPAPPPAPPAAPPEPSPAPAPAPGSAQSSPRPTSSAPAPPPGSANPAPRVHRAPAAKPSPKPKRTRCKTRRKGGKKVRRCAKRRTSRRR